jgi:tryptophan-rich sensory protein
MFFAAQNPGAGLINIIPQWLVIVAAVAAFWRVDRVAGWCLMPLAAWVGFATALNFEIWRLNG